MIRQEAKIYLRSVFAASCAVLLLFAVVVAIAGERIGSTVTFGRLADIQSSEREKIFLPFNLRYAALFKLAKLKLGQPDIIFISSSRAGAARSQMFYPYSFYNMSFTAWTLDQMVEIFERATRNAAPRVVLLELDYFLFTDAWVGGNADKAMIFHWLPGYLCSSAVDMIRSAFRHPNRVLSYALAAVRPFLGTQAMLAEEGFRYDGSYVYSSGHLRDSAIRNMNAEFLVNAMPGSPEVSVKQLDALRRLAELARQRHVTLAGVQLPFFKPAVDYLDTNIAYRQHSGVWREFESPQMRQTLEQMGIRLFDLAHDPLNGERENFVDAYHPSELGMRRSMQALLSIPQFKALFPDIEPKITVTNH